MDCQHHYKNLIDSRKFFLKINKVFCYSVILLIHLQFFNIKHYLPLCLSFLFCCFNANCRCFSSSRWPLLTVLRSVFNCSCCIFSACCDLVPIPAVCTCLRISRCRRLGLRSITFSSAVTAELNRRPQ